MFPKDSDTLFPTDPFLPCEGHAPANGKAYTLAELQKLVGGYIEVVNLPNDPGWIMIVDEEGRLKGLPENWTASGIAGQSIVGKALVCRSKHVQ